MTRTAIRRTFSTLATAALVFAVSGSLASAQGWDHVNRARGMLFPPGQAGGVAERAHGLATKAHSPRARSVSDQAVQKGLSLSDEQ
jgi:hypothetical protein